LGFDPVHPGGMNENSPAFQRRDRGLVVSSPEGTAESTVRRTALRDLCVWASIPSVETLGYFRLVPPGLQFGSARNPSGIRRRAWLNRSRQTYSVQVSNFNGGACGKTRISRRE